MKLKIVILISAGLIFGIIAFFALPHRSTKTDVIDYVFSSQQIYDEVTRSTNVIAVLLHRKPDIVGDRPGLLNEYNFDPPIQLPVAQAQEVRDLVLAPSSYYFSASERNCTPDYGVLFGFETATQTVHVAVCFKCDQLGVFVEDDNDRKVGKAEIDPSHNQFLAFAKSIFTNSTEIQSLLYKAR